MNTAVQNVPETFAMPPAGEMAHVEEGDVRERIRHLFRVRGDSAAMHSLEQAVLEYRLEQRR